jgi:AraC family transcriptional regulator, glycine betaine-responsive activator
MSRDPPPGVQHIGFVLLPGFALMSFAAAVEPLRAANIVAGREVYRWTSFSPSGANAMSSSGAYVPCAVLPNRHASLHTLFVIAGGNPADWKLPGVNGCLRALARRGVRLGGISGGPYVLAAAGLLSNRRFTLHWEHAPALMEAFSGLQPEPARFIIDRDRLTCGGGVAPLDMMHALIAERFGDAFARGVSDWFLHTHVGLPSEPQRASLAERYGVHHAALIAALEKMETTIATPLGRSAIAASAGITPRHLDRLFAVHLGTTFSTHYRRLRLDHARNLLRQSALSATEIAVACGFSGGAHFARRYRAEFGVTPSAERVRKDGRSQGLLR